MKSFLIRYKLLIIFLCAAVLASHILYVVQSHQYPQWDEHNYLSLAVKYLDLLQRLNLHTYQDMLKATGYLQPIYSFFIACILLIIGTAYTYKIALLLNGMFYVVSIVATYLLAREFFNKTTSFLAALIFAFYGNALFYLHFAYTETAITSLLMLSLLFLIRAKGFQKRKETVLTGIFFALAALTRWIAPVFYVGPFAVSMCYTIRYIWFYKKRRKNICINFCLFLIFGVLIPILLYFIPNAHDFLSYVQRNQQSGASWVAQYRDAGMANTFSTRSVMYFFNIISQNTIFFFLLFVAGLGLSFCRMRRYMVLIAGFIVPYTFLTFVAVWKEDRFIVPIYPIMAIISATVFAYIPKGMIKNIFIAVTVLVATLNFFGASWGLGPMGKKGLIDIVLPSFIHHPRRIYVTPLVWPATREYLNAHIIAQKIRESSLEKKTPTVVGAFTSEPLDNALQSIVWYHNRSLMQYKKFPFDLRDADFVITKSNDIRLKGLDQFQLIANIPIPMDNSTVTVYKHEKK